MKKILFIISIFVLQINFAKAQSSLPIQYLEVGKKILSNLKTGTESVLLPKTALPKVEVSPEISHQNIIDFAKNLIGVPYRYASSNPSYGFDCSGFVNYVFKNFGFKLPRSSTGFTKVGQATTLQNAQVGDILIFTGSNAKIRRVGHVGIVYANDENGIQFIHASSGKAKSVTITELNQHYKNRFMKIVRII